MSPVFLQRFAAEGKEESRQKMTLVQVVERVMDISPIAFKWGGGGHAQASGAKIKDLTELDSFIKDLDDLFATLKA